MQPSAVEPVLDVIAESVSVIGGDVHVQLSGGETTPGGWLFLHSLPHLRSPLAVSIGRQLDPDGYVVIDPANRTSRAPVYATDDLAVRPGMPSALQLVQAAADGCAAAPSCDQDRCFVDVRLTDG